MTILPKNAEYWRIIRGYKKVIKKSKICISCEYNNNGWCNKYKCWCSNCEKTYCQIS